MTRNIATSQTLLIDADDTLWENNVYFEEAIADFIERLNHQHLSREEVRAVINDVEREMILERGYGSQSFCHSLARTCERLSAEAITTELHELIWGFSQRLAQVPIQVIEGVPETLHYLSQREHHLIVMTKGDITEQATKVERSGLKDYFAAVEIVAEKDAPTYKGIVAKYQLASENTWMVGNSPKSDINPALAAGINAVFVPHGMTWILEHDAVAPVPTGVRLLEVERFADLQTWF